MTSELKRRQPGDTSKRPPADACFGAMGCRSTLPDDIFVVGALAGFDIIRLLVDSRCGTGLLFPGVSSVDPLLRGTPLAKLL